MAKGKAWGGWLSNMAGRSALCAAVLGAATACGGGSDESTPDTGSAFDSDENDDTLGSGPGGKADNATGYRQCAAIRSGKYALRGDVYTPTGLKKAAYLVVDGEKIADITTTKPTEAMPIVETYGVIFPGLIDGHGHVEYNHIPLADLGRRYQNRDQWPNAALYKTLVKDPKNAVTAAGLKCEGIKHGELRALVGGTTAIQGTPETSCMRHLVRNLEATNFCQDKVRQNVMGIVGFGRSISGAPSFADSIKSDITAKKLDAFAVHTAEGIDDHARDEWEMLVGFDLDRPQLINIHAAAFTEKEFTEAADVGSKMVWSPLSNLLLYGATADIPKALDAGMLVTLGADWAPSGSANLLWELKVADHVNKTLWGGRITDQQLVEFVTINAAKTWALDEFIGSLEVGKYADLLIVSKPGWMSAERGLITARPEHVKLVVISGDPLFGDPKYMDALGKQGDYELVDACGVQRGLDVTVTASDVVKGKQSLEEIESKLVAVNPKLTPVIDCENDEALKAYLGTPMEIAPQ